MDAGAAVSPIRIAMASPFTAACRRTLTSRPDYCSPVADRQIVTEALVRAAVLRTVRHPQRGSRP